MSIARSRLSLPQFAQLVGCTPQHAWQLSKDGVLPRPMDGTIAMKPSLRRYLAHLNKSPKVTNTQRGALLTEQARKLKMENDAREREIIPADAVIALAEALVGVVDDELTGWADRTARDRELRFRLNKEVAASHARIRATMAAALREALVVDFAEEVGIEVV